MEGKDGLYFEIHITVDKADEDLRTSARALGWKYSEFDEHDGATRVWTLRVSRRITLEDVRQRASGFVRMLHLRGIRELRTKIELTVYDTQVPT
jgi:hypothetical protein